jgi:hypothetical protein
LCFVNSVYVILTSQAKGGDCVRLDNPITILAISIKMKQHKKLLECNLFSDASYQNLGMMLNRQEPGHHPLGDASYLDLDTMLNEKGLNHHILSDALHRHSGVVKNE